MSKKKVFVSNNKFRATFRKVEKKLYSSNFFRLNSFIISNKFFYKLPTKRLIRRSRIQSYCLETGQRHSVYNFFKLSRRPLRDLFRYGRFGGIKKSSWLLV